MRRTRRPLTRRQKPRVFWYGSADANLAGGFVSVPAGTTRYFPLVCIPEDSPPAGLEITGAEAPHNDRFTIQAVRGQISVFNAGTGTCSMHLGIIVDRIYPGPTGAKLAEGAVGILPEMVGAGPADPMVTSWPNYIDSKWMWLGQKLVPNLSLLSTDSTFDIHIKSKRKLLQGEALWLMVSSLTLNLIPTAYVQPNLRVLLSKSV